MLGARDRQRNPAVDPKRSCPYPFLVMTIAPWSEARD